jgi:hypothetical protein
MFGPKEEFTRCLDDNRYSPNQIFRFRLELQAMGIDNDSLKVLTDEELMDLLNWLKTLYDRDRLYRAMFQY